MHGVRSSKRSVPAIARRTPKAVRAGRLGGKMGGPAPTRKLSARRRSEIAKKAGQALWAKET